jgi:hypothetical protein
MAYTNGIGPRTLPSFRRSTPTTRHRKSDSAGTQDFDIRRAHFRSRSVFKESRSCEYSVCLKASTLIVISHRASAFFAFSRLLTLSPGEIVEDGNRNSPSVLPVARPANFLPQPLPSAKISG